MSIAAIGKGLSSSTEKTAGPIALVDVWDRCTL